MPIPCVCRGLPVVIVARVSQISKRANMKLAAAGRACPMADPAAADVVALVAGSKPAAHQTPISAVGNAFAKCHLPSW